MTLSPNNNILEDQDYSNEENNINDQQIEIVDSEEENDNNIEEEHIYDSETDEYNNGENEDEDEEYNNNREGNENIECEDFGLQLLQIKDKHNISEAAFNEILKVFEIPGITLYKLRKFLGNFMSLKPTLVDCCINSCVAFTGELINKNICPECKEPRYKVDEESQISRKKAAYWSLIDSFQTQYKDKTRAEILRYRYNYTSTYEYTLGNQIGDVFDGLQYKTLATSGFFSDCRDIALMASIDGYQIFRQKRDDCWVILFINANLPPNIRVKRENLMVSALIPGPKAPKNFNSFLQPLIDELKQLQEGIQCIDGLTENTFTLHAHILSISGDIPALSKVMYTTGHNSYKACRFCSIRGIYCQGNRHVYFPLKPPMNMSGCQYNSENLPLRTHEDYIRDVTVVKNASGSSRKRKIQDRGVNGRSILFELNSIRFPVSFPVDIMHGLFENVAPAMLRHWSGIFFKDDQDFDSNYIIPNKDWTEIGKTMEKNRKNMPFDFGRPPINIQQHSAGFKAEDWMNWVVLYSLPLLQSYLPERHLNGWAKFVHATKLCLKHIISMEELTEIRREYIQNNSAQLPAALISYHYLLHIADSIYNTGPAWCNPRNADNHVSG
ncbi:hypothetical protein RirG_072760 [Rhizophagus irregularis DAOM 197198w]|uniref:Transposase domain-containing protein n=1 Tax=Rhizophagus irregularis (strain DAOM 197198w) TaxID=1432141 RepID=A0A015LHI1_RHIIW|nr:hypothetical protein RirG_072760 [Rhizophagus irregularis DAOM 197198w]